MDIFIEHIVRKKKDAKSYAVITLTVIAGVIALYFAPFLGAFAIFFVVAVGYAVYLVVTAQNVEFEYSITNSELDIDKIIYRRKRKRVLTLEMDKIARMEPFIGHIPPGMKIRKYCGALTGSSLYYAIFDQGKGREVLLFEPTEKMLAAFKKYKVTGV